MREYVSEGMICTNDNNHLRYAVCYIKYVLREDETYCYYFKPNYSVIDLLSDDVFQGIPGLNLDLKKEEYIRENRTPVFISERVPSENREDYYELLETVNMDYMDPIIYLTKTKLQYSGDKLYVIPFNQKEVVNIDFSHLNNNNSSMIKSILNEICIGNDVIINNVIIDDNNRKQFYNVLLALYSRAYELNKEKQNEAIKKAKMYGKFKGRKPIKVDLIKFRELDKKVLNKEIKTKEAANMLNISIDKYYRLRKQEMR